ncbi:hypothetical protein T265_02583 [Opisthorchis viverrini]|uniref:Uncharacterized protein n=1 Tax=Opisthorchis viverrini TaxID=6198 RepID=A0A074ZUK8_OPIVI|nr:hypothetical protein T265_02583 [Opisthorchis viverrini]KER31138.1 hypothetical protein T265_02583 [Opisthorchis viverrini]
MVIARSTLIGKSSQAETLARQVTSAIAAHLFTINNQTDPAEDFSAIYRFLARPPRALRQRVPEITKAATVQSLDHSLCYRKWHAQAI